MSEQVEEKKPRAKRFTRDKLINLGVVAVLLLLASAFHRAVFGDWSGLIAAIGGVVVGLLVAVLAYWLRQGIIVTTLMAVVAYFLFGGPIALPDTTIGGVFPSSQTLEILLGQPIYVWKDLLTLQPPASAFVGPTVLPYLVGLIAAVLAGSWALRLRHAELALIPVIVHAVIGVVWGVRSDSNLWVSVAMTAISVLWCAWLANKRRYGTGVVHDPLDVTEDTPTRRRKVTAGAAVMTLVAALAGGFVAPLINGDNVRVVARDYVVPEIDLTEYPAPLSSYRSYVDTRKDDVMMTVSGLKEGQRIRIAAMDYYNGVVYDMAPIRGEGGFVHTGEQTVDQMPPDDVELDTLDIAIEDYSGPWIPGSGELVNVQFDGPRASELADGFYYSSNLESALTMDGVQAGDEVQTRQIARVEPADRLLQDKAFGTQPMPPNENVPDVVAARAAEIIGQESSPIGQARRLEQHLHTAGYYSDGTDPAQGRAGHRSERIQSMLEAPEMVGDDEQYAVLMALMARSAGMPARVVMGFYPETYDAGAMDIVGADAHAWVEILFADAGWISFDPTPPRDQLLQTSDPVSHPNPAPRVIQPPDPPDEPAELPVDTAERDDPNDDEEEQTSQWGYIALGVAGILLLLLLPFLIIVLWKVIRTWRRRRRGSAQKRVTGSWDDILDAARDSSYPVDPHATRQEQANALDTAAPKSSAGGGEFTAAAYAADRAMFGASDTSDDDVEKAWLLSHNAKERLTENSDKKSWRSRLSLASLKKSRHAKTSGGKAPKKRPKRASKKDRAEDTASRDAEHREADS